MANVKTFLLLFLLVFFACSVTAKDPCHKFVYGKLAGRWISLYKKYPAGEWQRDVLIRNSGNPNWWDAEYEIVTEDSIKINSNFMIGWEYLVVLTKTDCIEFK